SPHALMAFTIGGYRHLNTMQSHLRCMSVVDDPPVQAVIFLAFWQASSLATVLVERRPFIRRWASAFLHELLDPWSVKVLFGIGPEGGRVVRSTRQIWSPLSTPMLGDSTAPFLTPASLLNPSPRPLIRLVPCSSLQRWAAQRLYLHHAHSIYPTWFSPLSYAHPSADQPAIVTQGQRRLPR
ncbi:hypothetical protein BDQ17DRAFT_1379604, partial [Cyathus striatus]